MVQSSYKFSWLHPNLMEKKREMVSYRTPGSQNWESNQNWWLKIKLQLRNKFPLSMVLD